MKWSVIVTFMLVSAASATTEEPETTTSRLHRSTFQEKLQWTTPSPTTEALPSELEGALAPQVDTLAAGRQSLVVPEQHKPDEDEPGKVKTELDKAPAAEADPGAVPTALHREAERSERDAKKVSVTHNATAEPVENKQNSSEATQTRPQRTTSVDGAAEFSAPIVSVELDERKGPSGSGKSFPPGENPALDLKLIIDAEKTSDEESKISTSESSSVMPSVEGITQESSTRTPEIETSARSETPVMSSPADFASSSTTDAAPTYPPTGVGAQETQRSTEQAPNAQVISTIGNHSEFIPSRNQDKPKENQTGEIEQASTPASLKQIDDKHMNSSESTSLAEVTPEPKLNEVKLSLNASRVKEDSSSVEELPALSMMALKAPPLVEFRYEEGTPKPPYQQNNAVQKEPAKPIGEITEDDHVVGNSHSTIDSAKDLEPPQPEGVLEIARKVTKMLEDKYAAEESRLHRRIGNVSLPNLPIVVQRATTSEPHVEETPSTLDYDYHSLDLMRLRAREHNNRNREPPATGRNPEPAPRTSKIMNPSIPPTKDKMIFIKTVPKGSLTTVDPSSTTTATVTFPSTVISAGAANASAPEVTVAERTKNLTSLETSGEIQSYNGTTTRKTIDDDYYDEPTEIVDEEDVVSSPEKITLDSPSRQPDIEATRIIEDRPVMALVVQNPPNENSLTRKELKPLDTKDLQVSFIIPAVSEPSLVPHEDKDATLPTEHETDELSTEGIGSTTQHSLEAKFGKPYPMQRFTTSTTTERPTIASADDRYDSAPTVNPMTTLAGGESSSEIGEYKLECPSKEDIHPCTCVTHEDDYDDQIETVATCRGIKHSATLIEALRGFRGHHLTYLIIDNSDLPPFPNNILHRIQVDWMEVLNTPVQFKREYLQCSIKCTLS
ncbi:proteoglycan 4 [Galendromus occidentalis]|uniref:Proteoglycan 4 n=1 Tax=Galendromus occidentalis TaxID=34638 RepID=A0AAJ6VY90_9ACAR|nr:proteoglycan 4 [Galendromus occidentalis]